MSDHLASLAALASLWVAIALAVSLGTRPLWPILARATRDRAPAERAGLAWLAAAGPVAIPSGVVLLCALPGVMGSLTGLGDHCAGHGAHRHFCPVHATFAWTPLIGVGLIGFTALVALLALETASPLRLLAREERWLARRRAAGPASDVDLVADERPIALTHGLVSPRIWISRALYEALSGEEREVVIAHERAHAARRDPARFLVATAASLLHGPRTRARILADLRLATEQACDAHAAAIVGDRLRVASTLLHVERLMRCTHSPRAFAAALVDTSLPARIEALIAANGPGPGGRARSRWLWLVPVAALLLASPVHHLAEHALEALLRSMVGVHLLS